MAMTEEDFMEAVEEGLKLSKRLYFGKDRSVAPPKPPPPMSKFPRFYLPTAPMVYAVVSDPGIVDNPDIPSYQPYVYGRCDPPALIPLQMNNVSMEVDCYLDTVFVSVSGEWRVHCVMGSKSCDCRLAVPMGEQVIFCFFFFPYVTVCVYLFASRSGVNRIYLLGRRSLCSILLRNDN